MLLKRICSRHHQPGFHTLANVEGLGQVQLDVEGHHQLRFIQPQPHVQSVPSRFLAFRLQPCLPPFAVSEGEKGHAPVKYQIFRCLRSTLIMPVSSHRAGSTEACYSACFIRGYHERHAIRCLAISEGEKFYVSNPVHGPLGNPASVQPYKILKRKRRPRQERSHNGVGTQCSSLSAQAHPHLVG